jgi:hypothetical protein
MKDRKTVGMLVLGGLAIWAFTRKPEIPKPEVTKPPVPVQPAPVIQKPVVPEATRPPISEIPIISMDVYDSIESTEQIPIVDVAQTLPTGETYNPVAAPGGAVAIEDTGFNIWGVTEDGAMVISMNDPSTYDAWEWF